MACAPLIFGIIVHDHGNVRATSPPSNFFWYPLHPSKNDDLGSEQLTARVAGRLFAHGIDEKLLKDVKLLEIQVGQLSW